MQGTISPGLQKLMQSVQELKQVSSPQTPSGTPTIAGQVEQAAAQVASQAAPSAEMPGMLPNDPYRAQLMQTLQAQAQEQAQRMAMLAQGQPPQGGAGGGIASLPGADVEMAEGGVVGYNGKDGSKVEIDDGKKSFLERLPEGAGLRRLAEWYRAGRPRLEKPLIEYLLPSAAAPVAPVAPVARPMSEMETARLQEANAAPAGMPVAAPAPRPSEGQRQKTSAQRKPAAETAKPADTGIASLVGPPVPSGSERQFGEALSTLGRITDPTKRTPEQIAAEREALYRARGIEPGKAERERLAKLEAFDAQEEAERKKRVDQRGMQDLITFLTGFGGASSMVEGGRRGSAASAQLRQDWERSDEAYNLLKRQRMDAITAERVALDNRNRALADGDIATAAKEAEAVRAAQNARVTAEAELRGRFAPQLLQAETAAMQEEGRAREGAANRANALEIARINRATASMPSETERIFNKFNALKATDPVAAEQYLQNIERIKGLGRGVEEKAEFARLRQQATMLQNELKAAMETDPLGKSPRIADLRAKLDGIYKQLGGESAPAAGRTMTMADVQATAKASGKTVDEVKKAATAAGYTVQ